MLVQFVAAVPWLVAWTWQSKRPDRKAAGRLTPLTALGRALAIALGAGLVVGWLLDGVRTMDTLEGVGKAYGSVLQLQLQIDLLVILFTLMTWLWPKGAAVARGGLP